MWIIEYYFHCKPNRWHILYHDGVNQYYEYYEWHILYHDGVNQYYELESAIESLKSIMSQKVTCPDGYQDDDVMYRLRNIDTEVILPGELL